MAAWHPVPLPRVAGDAPHVFMSLLTNAFLARCEPYGGRDLLQPLHQDTAWNTLGMKMGAARLFVALSFIKRAELPPRGAPAGGWHCFLLRNREALGEFIVKPRAREFPAVWDLF